MFCRISNGFDGIEIEDSGVFSKLTFFNVSETDYGNYTCIAINKLGSANTSIVLYGEFVVLIHTCVFINLDYLCRLNNY